MRIVTVRRISQVFFFGLFAWFCIVATVGEEFGHWRGWPINWFLQLDPLVALGTILTTHTLYWPLVWALVTVVLTILVGRFFCGWVCPFGSLHQVVGFLGKRGLRTAEKIDLNRYRPAQQIKYYVLTVFLAGAAFPSAAASLQTGLLDPIPLITRSFNLVLLAIVDRAGGVISSPSRYYEGAWLVLVVFLSAVLLNLVVPRFYCRFICPLGALFAVLNRFAIWRIGKRQRECIDCKLCEQHCEGACEPAGRMRISECVLCFNCLHECPDDLIHYQVPRSAAGEITNPDVSRRGFALSLVSGIFALGALRLGARTGSNWYHRLIRPPGALPEEEFLKRCIKCGQCMRVCPTNVLQPAGIEGGLEGLWTPVLNNRIGSSGCQLNCTACGQACPTAAIRPISLAEKRGMGAFAERGPIRLGTAFVDRSRCLAWAMDKPCIVCQENCPVSPKAIYTQDYFSTLRDGLFTIERIYEGGIETAEGQMEPGRFATGDYYCAAENDQRVKILENTAKTIVVAGTERYMKNLAVGEKIRVQIRLQRPYVDIEKCIGCGICEHECPVSGKKAIRISAEGETRSIDRRLLLEQ